MRVRTYLRWSLCRSVNTLLIIFACFAYNHELLTEHFFDLSVLLCLIIPVICCFGYLAYLRVFVRPEVNENLDRLNQIASRCSRIVCFVSDLIDQDTLSIISKTLENVTINEILIFDKVMKKGMRFSKICGHFFNHLFQG